MNGVHDMGGMTDFGPVRPEAHEPVFHAEWERRVFGMVRIIIDGQYNWDEFRFAIERIDPVAYLSSSYYERWLTALERYLTEKGVVSVDDFRHALDGWTQAPGTAVPQAATVLASPDPTVETAPRFAPGDRVLARNINPMGHTRLPRYVRGKRGVIERFLNVFIFPDANALQLGSQKEPVYAVRFSARELWGAESSSQDSVCVDLWESYLLPDGAFES